MVDVGRDPATGRRRQRSRTLRGSRRDAERALNQMLSDADRSPDASIPNSLKDLLDRWLDLVADDLSPTTLQGYRGLIRRRIVPALGLIQVRNLTATQLDTFYLALVRDAGLAPATVRQVHAIIRRALRQAVKWGWITSNPAANATPPRVRRPDIAPPSLADVHKLITEADTTDPEFAPYLRVVVATGLRRGETCALRWVDLDVEAGTLLVEHSIIAVMGRGILEKDTKTHAARRIALDPQTIEVLIAHRQVVEDRARACGTELVRDAFIFSFAPDGRRPWYPDSASSAFARLRKRVGLDTVRLHDLRHMHATQLLAAGVPVRTVSGRLGHANAATTLNVYGHFLEASDRHAAEVIGDLLEK
jgi:integrase